MKKDEQKSGSLQREGTTVFELDGRKLRREQLRNERHWQSASTEIFSNSQLIYFAEASVLMSPPETAIATSPTSSLSLAYAELNQYLLQLQAVAPSRLFGPPWI